MQKIRSSEITPEQVYLNRRKFMVGAGSLAAGALALAACSTGIPTSTSTGSAAPAADAAGSAAGAVASDQPKLMQMLGPDAFPPELASMEPVASSATDELGDPLNSYEEITNYNNYYEFSTTRNLSPQSRRSLRPPPGSWK